VIKLKSDEATRQVAQADAHLGQYQSVINEKNQLEAAKSEEINQLRDELNKAQAQLESVRNDLTEELTKARQKQSEQADSHADEVQDLKTDIFLKQNKILQLADRIGFLEREINKEQTFAQVTPDGEILRVADAEGFAWINLGRNHRLRRGLVFDVFQYVKGGRKLRKGKVEVARVEDDYAEVRVLESLDRFNPISAGDKIASPFYEQDATPVFVIAGDKMFNERLSREEVVRRIQRFGGQVEDDVRVETTYLVAIDGYQDSSQYKTARELGVTVLRENELLEFIGF
ncbi:MAG: BRCT domain-containing protein, partial [Planctomycetota bacterium]